ncbi:MAG: carbamoyl-phosphate synthase large subunit, partial [Syntrophomonas sp.]|nr:carbamoyl-phosphate synthase large subunit [Syntrophomonas sp.]
TGKTMACFEPALDYLVLKMPRWPFDKFAAGQRRLGTQMKATGEVMAIDRRFEAALLKAVRSLDLGLDSLNLAEMADLRQDELERRMEQADDQRLFVIAEALARGMSIDTIHQFTKINRFFLHKIKNIVDFSRLLQQRRLDPQLLKEAKQLGFTDRYIAQLQETGGEPGIPVRQLRQDLGIAPVYKMVDTCAAEFDAVSPYFYSSYEAENEAWPDPSASKVLVIGSGPIRIGQGIEFDYCSVHCAWALQESGTQAVIINNNPETVSTDFDTSDRLYFEPLAYEDVMNIIELEQPEGVIVQFGGQNAINLAASLHQAGVKILGTGQDSIDRCEDRQRFDCLLQELGIPRAPGRSVTSLPEAAVTAATIGYPVLVRPSYVLGGRAMEIVDNQEELERYMTAAVRVHTDQPVLVDKYLLGQELEVDAVADGEEVLIPGIMQHIERAGIHSGDSMAVFPAYNLKARIAAKVVDYTTRLALALQVKGIINIQFVEHEEELYVIEVNPRSSRTVPFVSKVTGLPLVKLATLAGLGRTLRQQGYKGGLQTRPDFYAVKVPVFSFGKLEQVDVSLGPEMKSTGEVLGLDKSLHMALYKGLQAAGMHIPDQGTIAATIADRDKQSALPLLEGLARLGYRLVATEGTARALAEVGVRAEQIQKITEGNPNIVDLLKAGQVDLIVNTLTQGRSPSRDGFQIRRTAVELNVPVLTSLDTLQVLLEAIREHRHRCPASCVSLQEYLAGSFPWVDAV